jgi:hypothetical protein
VNISDADEPVAPLKQDKKTKAVVADRALKATGLMLAGLSAFFPWYVFFNPDKFGIHVTENARSRDLPNWPALSSAFRRWPWSTRTRIPSRRKYPTR